MKPIFNLRRTASLLTLAATTLAATAGAGAEEFDIRLGTQFAPSVPIVACGAIPMAEDQNLIDAGIRISVIHSSQLGSENQLAEQLSSGELEIAPITSSVLAAWAENMAVLETYYLYKDVDQVMQVYETPTAQELRAELLDASGMRIIGQPWLYGERNVFGNKAIHGPDDFSGVRMRVPETFVSIEGAKSLGAQPTPVAYAELYLALQQGIVDVAEAPLSVIAAESFDEPASHVNMTRHLITALPFVVSDGFWQEMSEEQQTALETAVIAASARVRECVQEATDAALAAWAENGNVEVVDDLDIEAIREKSQAYFSDGLPFSETYARLVEELNQ
jgi:TRAP-type transport system periplasmic protein